MSVVSLGLILTGESAYPGKPVLANSSFDCAVSRSFCPSPSLWALQASVRAEHDPHCYRSWSCGVLAVSWQKLQTLPCSWTALTASASITRVMPCCLQLCTSHNCRFIIGLWPLYGLLTPLIVACLFLGGMMVTHFIPVI